MPSYTIPEDVIGVPLFVPNDYNYFSIESAGMPNGDSCLKVLGATNRNGKAFQPAQTPALNVFKNRNPGEWAITFWLKASTAFLGGGYGANGTWGRAVDTMISVSSPDFVPSANNGDGSNGDYSTAVGSPYGLAGYEYIWAVAASSVGGTGTRNGMAFTNPRVASGVAAGSGARAQTAGTGVFDNTWHLWTMNVSNVASSTAWYKDNSVTASNGTSSSQTSVNITYPTLLYLCIGGGYTANATGPDADWYIGKLGFHNGLLNSTQRALLYSSMMISVPVTINKGSSQADPATGSTITFDVVFGQPVTGFGTSDVTLSGTAGATTVGVSGTGASYIVTVSGMTTPGTVIASIPSGIATNAAGGTNLASTSTDNSVAWS